MFIYRNSLCLILRNYGTKIKPRVVPDETVFNDIEKNLCRPKTHPGIFKPRAFELPEAFVNAVQNVIEDYPIKSLIDDGREFVQHLRDKRPPIEEQDLKKLKQDTYAKVVSQIKTPNLESDADRIKFQQKVSQKVNNVLRGEVYNWKAITYDAYKCLVYLVSRSPAEFAVLAKIFKEIAERDPEFKPRSVFDFGSGVGTAMWAVNLYWKKYIFEYFNVDSSSDMNDLSQILLQKGKGTNQSKLKGVFYRQFLPATNTAYDLVVCAYTLLELPSRQARLNTILNLWNKTTKYLVIVEQGSNHGFQVINEVRDLILHLNDNVQGHVFSPCPHDKVCPRFVTNDGSPCNFEAFYFTLSFQKTQERKQERYSYVVLKKGKRDPSDPQWPRVVRESLIRSRHTICRMCTKDANLEEVIFSSSKHGKTLYHCARATKWGDLLPISIEKPPEEPES